MTLYPLLGQGELLAHDGLGVPREVGVPERVVADLVASVDQVLELARGKGGLVEEAIRWIGTGQDVEGCGVAEFRMRALEGLEDADRTVGVDDPFASLRQEAKLPRRGVVEGEDHGCRAAWKRDRPLDEG